jgi:hypothetical protein
MSSLFTFRFPLVQKKVTKDILLFFPASRVLDAVDFADALEREIESNLVPDEVIVLVRDPAFDQALEALGKEAASTALNRLRGRATVHLKSYDAAGHEARNHRLPGADRPSKVSFDDFRRRAVTHIFRTRRGFVESTGTYHFENPSGRHTQRFIRLSNILARGAEIAFIGFCALPHIASDARVVYLDTPSLYAVVAAINEQRSSFDVTAIPLMADNFSSYEGLEQYGFGPFGGGVALISASSSGGLAKRLVDEFGFSTSNVVHLLFLGENASAWPAVCDLQRDEKTNPEGFHLARSVWQAGSCELCSRGSIAIRLQGDQFDIAGPQPEPLLIRKADAHPGLTDFIFRVSGTGVLRVGLDGNAAKRPRLFDVDEEALLSNRNFLERLDFLVRRSLPAGTSHIITTDEKSRAFANHIRATLGDAVKVVDALDIKTIPHGVTSAMVVVSAVVESGRSLQDISRDLRSIASKAPLVYLVGLSKSSGETRRESLGATLVQTDLVFKHQLFEVERVILPPSSAPSAWSAELELLSAPDVMRLASGEVRQYLGFRLDFLRSRSKSFVDGLFLANAPDRELTLQEGFVFWKEESVKNHCQADVFYTMASVLQKLRANALTPGAENAIRSNWFQQTILAPGNFGRFNDDIIQASLLRAAYPFEMNYTGAPDDSREMARLVCRIVTASTTARGGAAAEFLLALATRRLQLMDEDLSTVLALTDTDSVVVAFLQQLCRSRLGVSAAGVDIAESKLETGS